MSRWYAWKEGPVRAGPPCSEGPEVSPSGAYLAWLPERAGGVPLEERERVRVADLHTDEVVCSMEGRGNVRTLHWVRDDRLLVTRDAKGGTWLGMYEIPGGNLLSEGFLPGVIERRHRVSHTPDGRALCLSPRELDARDLARWIVDGETLAVRSSSTSSASWCVLHPDGATVAVSGWEFGDPQSKVWLETDPPIGPRVAVSASDQDLFVARWAGRDELRVLYGSNGSRDECLLLGTADLRAGTFRQTPRVRFDGGVSGEFSEDGAYFFAVRALEPEKGQTALFRLIDVEDGTDVLTVVRPCAKRSSAVWGALRRDAGAAVAVVSNAAEWTLYFIELPLGVVRSLSLSLLDDWAVDHGVYGPWFAYRVALGGSFRLIDLREAR